MTEHTEDDHTGVAKSESLMDKITEKLHGHDSSSSSDSDNEKPIKSETSHSHPHAHSPSGVKPESSASAVKSAVYRLFGRQKPVHKVFGGGKPADVLLWRNKKISGGVLGVATAIWVLFELLEYHCLTLVCHCLILALASLFLWSNATVFIKKSPPHIPNVHLHEEQVHQIAEGLRNEINRALCVLREIAAGHDLKKFLAVIAGLWVLSIVGSWCNFLTFVYIAFVLLHTVPVLYEKYEDQVDSFAEKAMREIKKQYAVFDEKVLSKIPKGPSKDKKKA